MAAYAIFIREEPVRDPAEIEIYQKKAAGGGAAFNMKLLALYGACQAVEGKAVDGVVLLEFPTLEDAKAWYNSPAYQAAAPHRRKGAEYRAILFEGR
jgi:uncharacterized protein (DUF1330 family)